MTVVDLRNRKNKIIISNFDGSNPLDITPVLVSGLTSDTLLQLPTGGIIRHQGNIELAPWMSNAFPESLHPKLNPTRWVKGAKLSIQIANTAGVLKQHPRGTLYLLEVPEPPSFTETAVLSLRVGCRLTLMDYRQPPNNASDIKLGESTLASDLINKLAARINIPGLQQSIPEFPLNYPIYNLESGSFVDLMGAIACARKYVLFMDKNDNLRVQRIPELSSNPSLSKTVGVDEDRYIETRSNEIPVENVRVVGTTKDVTPQTDPEPTTIIERDPGASASSTAPVAIIETQFSGTGTASPSVYTRTRQPKRLVMPDIYPDSNSLITAQQEYRDQFFEEGGSERLLKDQSRIYKPRGAVLPTDFPGETGSILAQRITRTPIYDDEEIRQIKTFTEEPAKVVDPNNTSLVNKTTLVPSGLTVESWKPKGDGYLYSKRTVNYKKTRSGIAGSNPGSAPSYSSTGNQPPQPTRRPQSNSSKNKRIVGRAKFKLAEGSASFQDRSREWRVPDQVAVSKNQLDELALLIGQLLIGRQYGIRWTTAIDDFWLDSYQPLIVMDWTCTYRFPDQTFKSRKDRYLVNGLTIGFNQDSASIGGDGIHLAKIGSYTSEPTPENPTPTPIEIPEPVVNQVIFSEAVTENFGTITIALDQEAIDLGPEIVSGTTENFGTIIELPELFINDPEVTAINTESFGTVTIENDIQDPSSALLIEMAAAAEESGAAPGTGLDYWAVWLAENYNASTHYWVNAGNLGGDAVGVGTPFTVIDTAANGRKALSTDGSARYMQIASDPAYEVDTWTIFAYVREPATGSTQKNIWTSHYLRFDPSGTYDPQNSNETNTEEFLEIYKSGSSRYRLETGKLFNDFSTARSEVLVVPAVPFLISGVWKANNDLQLSINEIKGNVRPNMTGQPLDHVNTRLLAGSSLAGTGGSANSFWQGDCYLIATCSLDLTTQAYARVEAAIKAYYDIKPPIEEFKDTLSAVAIEAGGTGLDNWFIFSADTYQNTQSEWQNSGALGGNATLFNSPPVITTNALNGKQALNLFAGNSQTHFRMGATPAMDRDVFTFFALHRRDASTLSTAILDIHYDVGNSSNLKDFIRLSIGSAYELRVRNATGTGVVAHTANNSVSGTTYLLTSRWRADNTLRLRAVSTATNAALVGGSVFSQTSVPSSHLFTNIGKTVSGFGNNEALRGLLFMVAWCNLDLTDAQVAKVRQAFNEYYLINITTA